MRLPDDSIGISDLLAWRECPQRFALQMRRHGEAVPGEIDWKNAYGSAIHDAIHIVAENGSNAEQAVTKVWPTYAGFLDPEDLALLKQDIERYRGDTPLGMEPVGFEMEGRVPLFLHEGRQIYFRFRIDALYRRRDDHTVFYHRDYKSSKWRKTQAEVDSDPQMWAYNWAIHELYPECRSLLQSYEQLRFGNLPTSKNDDQRSKVKPWLIETTRAVLEDEDLKPRQNEWCPYCPLLLTCDETKRATRVWQSKLALLAPMTQEGRKTKITLSDAGADLEEMVASQLPKMIRTRKHLEAAEEAMKQVIARMPSEERERLGWRMSERRTTFLPPEALRALHEAMGDSFYEAIGVTKSAMEKVAGKPELEMMHAMELERITPTGVRQA